MGVVEHTMRDRFVKHKSRDRKESIKYGMGAHVTNVEDLKATTTFRLSEMQEKAKYTDLRRRWSRGLLILR